MKRIILIIISIVLMFCLVSCGKTEKIDDKVNVKVKSNIPKKQTNILIEKEKPEDFVDTVKRYDKLKFNLLDTTKNMPKMLRIFKTNKKCLIDANDKQEAKDCQIAAGKLAKELEIDNLYKEEIVVLDWSDEFKTSILDNLDEGIAKIENLIPCAEKASTLISLMRCENF